MAAQEQTDLGIRTLCLEKDKKREEVWSLKPTENQPQEDGAMGREDEVLVAMRGAGWLSTSQMLMQWQGFNRAGNSVKEKAAWSSLSHKDLETKG